MSQNYTPRHFLRHAPNAMLRSYFEAKGIILDVDWDKLRETEAAGLLEPLSELPQWKSLQADFYAIFTMACDRGVQQILEEGRFQELPDGTFHQEDLEPYLADLQGLYAKAFWTFFERPTVFSTALRFVGTRNLTKRYWRKYPNFPDVTPAMDTYCLTALERAISQYFKTKDGRGSSCRVDAYERDNRYFYFAYPEDYSRDEIVWEAGHLEKHIKSPAFEIVFVFDSLQQSLDIFHRGSKTESEQLRLIFASALLGQELAELMKDDRVYELNQLQDRAFQFVYNRDSGIRNMRVTRMRLTSISNPNRKVILEADNGQNSNAVYDLLEQQFSVPNRTPIHRSGLIPLSAMNVTQVEIKVTFERGARTKTVAFNLTFPNSCTLKYDEDDLLIREILINSRLEPTRQTLLPEQELALV